MIKLKSVVAFLITVVLFCKSSIAFSQNYYTINDKLDTTLLNNSQLFPAFNDSIFDDIKSKAGIESNKSESDAIQTHLRNNIAVIYFYENDSLVRFHDSALLNIEYIPAMSQAMYYNDTLHVSASVGFFAGMGVTINISQDKFDGKYFQDADNTLVFKKSSNDKKYSSSVMADAEKQTLVLNKTLSYKNNEVFFGEFEGNFRPFYEKEQQKDLLKRVRIKVIFKCMSQDYGHIKMRE